MRSKPKRVRKSELNAGATIVVSKKGDEEVFSLKKDWEDYCKRAKGKKDFILKDEYTLISSKYDMLSYYDEENDSVFAFQRWQTDKGLKVPEVYLGTWDSAYVRFRGLLETEIYTPEEEDRFNESDYVKGDKSDDYNGMF